MRRTTAILALAAFIASGLPAASQATGSCTAPAGGVIIFCDDFSTEQGWTEGGDSGTSTGAGWKKSTYGNGDEAAWFVGYVDHLGTATGASGNHPDEAFIWLQSPAISIDERHVKTIQYDLEGYSEVGFDFMIVQVQHDGGGWSEIARYDDEAVGGYTTFTHNVAAAGFEHGVLELRWVLDTDELLPDGSGYYLDNIHIDGEVIDPRPPFEPPTLGTGNAGNQPPEVIDVTISDSAVSIPDESVTITASTEDDSGVVVTRLLMQNEHGDILDVGLTKTSETPGDVGEPTEQTWSITLQGTDARLFTGTYTGGLFAYDADGGIGGTSQTALSMGVSTSAPAPTVGVVEYDASAEILLSPEDALRFLVGSDILAGVRYTSVHEDGAAIPSFKFPSPYVLPASSLLPGRQTLSVIAEDRAHREVEMQLLVVVDGDAPDLRLFEVLPTYAGVPSEVHFITKDAIEHSVVFTLNGTVTRIPGGKDIDHRMPFQFDAPGQYGWSLRAEDSAGNRLFETGKINVSVVPTDVALSGLRLGDSHPLLGDAVSFVVDVAQQGGVIPVPVGVDFQVGDWEETQTTTVAVASKQSVTASHAFPVGTYTVLASAASTLPHHNDTNLDNQIQALRFEVFLGKTVTPNGTYWIRADERGLPSAAVDANNVSYELRLVEFEGRTQYNFTAGSQDWYWDPLQRVTTNTVEDPAKKEDAPGLPLLAVLVLLGVLGRRRK